MLQRLLERVTFIMAESIIIPQFPPDLSGYASRSHSHSDYALTSHTHSQYLTSHQSLSGYATQSWVSANFAPKGSSSGGDSGSDGGNYTDVTFNIKASYGSSIIFDKTQISAGFTISSAECISHTGTTGWEGTTTGSRPFEGPISIPSSNTSGQRVMTVPGYDPEEHTSGSIEIIVRYYGSVVYIGTRNYYGYMPGMSTPTNAIITIRCYR